METFEQFGKVEEAALWQQALNIAPQNPRECFNCGILCRLLNTVRNKYRWYGGQMTRGSSFPELPANAVVMEMHDDRMIAVASELQGDETIYSLFDSNPLSSKGFGKTPDLTFKLAGIPAAVAKAEEFLDRPLVV